MRCSEPVEIKFLILSFCVASLAAISLLCGAEKVSLLDAVKGDALSCIILLHLRLPRTLLALITGAMLGGAGAVSQMYFRNPIAEPGIMGLSAGSTLGAAIAVSTLGARAAFAANIGAFIGALLVGILLLSLLERLCTSPVSLLLAGSALGTFCAAITSIILLVKTDSLRAVYVWTLGSMSGKGWGEVRFILPLAVLAFCALQSASKDTDLLCGGEAVAASLGVEVKRLQALVLVSLSLSVSAAVCAAGTIGFVGLIAPHIARRIFSPAARRLLPASSLFGAALLLASDAIARSVTAPSELPVGVITALIGAPFFFYITVQSTKGRIF